MAKLPELPNVRIVGPCWTAEASVIRLADPTSNLTLRALFVDRNPRQVVGQPNVLVPGTLLALVFVTKVTVSPTNAPAPQYVWQRSGTKPDGKLTPQALKDAIDTGKAALVLLGAPPDGWPKGASGKLPTLTCLGGDIGLDTMIAQGQATQKLYAALGLIQPSTPVASRSGAARLPGALSVHASGLSVYGQIRLLWDTDEKPPISAVFQVARLLPDPQSTGGPIRSLRMTIEAERLTETERRALLESWRRFNRYVNPRNPLNSLIVPPETTQWATLELANPLTLPRLFWELVPWQEQPGVRPIQFAGDEFSVLLSDRQPYDPATPPDTLARIVPQQAKLQIDGTNLRLGLTTGGVSTANDQLSYQAHHNGGAWTETITLEGATLACNPNEVARFLRTVQGQIDPQWVIEEPPAVTKPIAMPRLWGCMPLSDGWAQMPFPNLTQQIYLDAQVAHAVHNSDGSQEQGLSNVLRGAVSYGNDDPAVLGSLRDEQPWSLTLTATQQMTATWTLARVGTDYQVDSAHVTLPSPEITLDGLFWLSTVAPTAADALPNVDDWIAGLASLPLHTVTGRELFPPLMRQVFDTLTFSFRTTPNAAVSATLDSWSFVYDVDSTLFKTLVDKRVLPASFFSAVRPLVWRRHPTLPMVQALALTQSLTPPNEPIPNRQLVPFELATASTNNLDLPQNWRFKVVNNGAINWPQFDGTATPAREWTGVGADAVFDLPLVALSLPGLVLDPRPEGDPLVNDPNLALPVQYRYDLPYIDEIQALAQLPKIMRDPRESSPLPDAPRPEPPRPLTRDDYAEHWRRLAERASLASADAVTAFSQRNGQTVLRHLVEPYDWLVRAELVLDTYPGALTLDNAAPAQSASIVLQGEQALGGISGRFAITNDNLNLLPPDAPRDDTQLIVVAGGMHAQPTTDGSYRDQRGLARAASQPGVNLLKTTVSSTRASDNPANGTQTTTVQLTTTRTALTLTCGTSDTWRLWFRDLPVAGTIFIKSKARSDKVQQLDLDINDPEARSSDIDYLAGYEWRLRPLNDDPDLPLPFVQLGGLHFYPLVLDTVTCEDDGVTQIEVLGRLQLPLAEDSEQSDLSNVVRLTFNGSGTQLALKAIALDMPPVQSEAEWPLAASGGEGNDAPRLYWKTIKLGADPALLTIGAVQLRYVLFGVDWSVSLPDISFPNPNSDPFVIPRVDPSAALIPDSIHLVLDTTSGLHRVTFTLAVQLGPAPFSASLQALYTFTEGSGNVIHDQSGVGKPLDLSAAATGGMSWGQDGLTITKPTLIRSDGPAAKVIQAIRATNELSIEVWVKPSNVTKDGPTRIVTLSTDANNRDVTLQQGKWEQPASSFIDVRLRTSTTNANGDPATTTPVGSVTTELTHVIYTRTADGTTRIYINGVVQAVGTLGGTFNTWDTSYALALGDELSGSRAWLGTYRMVALYNRALSAADVAARYLAGPLATPLMQRSTFAAKLTFDLMIHDSEHIPDQLSTRFALSDATLFGVLRLSSDVSPAALVGETTLAFAWQSYTADHAERLQLLPGMQLADEHTGGLASRIAPGFATIAFRAKPQKDALPQLDLTSAFLEAIVLGHWGTYLQDDHAGTADASRIFRASAGDITLGYTGRWQNGAWSEGFLLNGMLEIKNLISWPQPLAFDAVNARLRLPAARTSARPQLNHMRHTIRVLLNQHELPAQLIASATGPLLFTFAPGQSWQFLAVVEHQLVQIQPTADASSAQLGRDVRWTIVQEVRLLLPATVTTFLRDLDTAQTIDQAGEINDLNNTSTGLFGAGVRSLLADSKGALDKLPADTLLVEASAHHLVKLDPVLDSTSTTLQYLPTGSQGALLSKVQDYAPSDPQQPRWLLLTLPFLGRLQDAARDGLSEPLANPPNPLQVDPLLILTRQRAAAPTQALSDLALALSGWTDNTPLDVAVASFDTAVGRSFARLDPLALEESWFRAHNPRPEPQVELLQSVLAALPNTPARLSRSIALRRAFDPRRTFYPPQDPLAPKQHPQDPETYLLALPDEPEPLDPPVWRENSLLLTQAVTTVLPTSKPPYGWLLTAALIASSTLLDPEPLRKVPDAQCRYAAATLLPTAQLAANSAASLSLVISPYLGLEWRPAPLLSGQNDEALKLKLLLVELLCFSPGTTRLQPVASRLWTVQPDAIQSGDENQLRALARDWALQSQKLLAPESPIAVLRFRTISDNTGPDTVAEAALTTGYSFALVPVSLPGAGLARRVFRMRSPLAQIRFREGQCNNNAIPVDTHDFELAPPQTIGMQSLSLNRRPMTTVPPLHDWPWGMSALRASIQYTKEKAGVVGRAAPPDGVGLTLWWQAVQRNVQFRSAQHTTRPTGGLPHTFRAVAMRNLLPVLADPPLPTLEPSLFEQPALPQPSQDQQGFAEDSNADRWQPVLPGAVRYLATGARPGVFVALRHQLLRQSGVTFTGAAPRPRGLGLVSGSIPVQHRVPRPVTLPKNLDKQQDIALQTWANYYDPISNCLATFTPVDEAFRAGFAEPVNNPTYTQTPQRILLQLVAPPRYALDSTWDGTLTFVYRIDGSITQNTGAGSTSTPTSIANWKLALELSDGQRVLPLRSVPTKVTPTLRAQLQIKSILPPTVVVANTPDDQLPLVQFKLDSQTPAPDGTLQSLVTAFSPGAHLTASMRVGFVVPAQPPSDILQRDDRYLQTLIFPLRVADANAPRLPLEPRFIHFEDPEYNRRLASPSAHSAMLVQFPKTFTAPDLRTLTLSAERRECNADSTLAIRFDWEPVQQTALTYALRIQHIDLEQTPRDLTFTPTSLAPQQIVLLALSKLQRDNNIAFGPGERLRIKLEVSNGPIRPTSVQLDITIVETPVIPATEAAYALLRKQTINGQSQVECVRFAWGPAAQRVELVNPDDLKTEVVRRRAVFHFIDSARPGTVDAYSIQKLSQTGSTHVPEFK